MTKKILVPLDGSKLAEMALPHAVALARANLYGITLLRVVPQPVFSNSISWAFAPAANVFEGWEDEVRYESEYLEVMATRLRTLGIEVETRLLEDDPASALVAFAGRHPDAAFIVMSTHGRSGLSRWLLGSVAEKVLHASPVPLLLVRPRENDELPGTIEVPSYRSILVPLDGSELSAQALDQAEVLANEFDATITLVSAVSDAPVQTEIMTPPALPIDWDDEADKLRAYLDETPARLVAEGYRVSTHLEFGPAAEAILHVAEQVHADLIVMSTHGRSGLARLWLGSVAMKVVQAASLPVLLVRSKQSVAHAESTKGEKLTV